MLGEPLFCRGVGLGLVMPLGHFPPNVAVGLLASVRVLYARNLYDMGKIYCDIAYLVLMSTSLAIQNSRQKHDINIYNTLKDAIFFPENSQSWVSGCLEI